MNVTTLPVGTTGQFLEGVAVSTGVRESVILTSPTDQNAFAEIVSSQPIPMYGLPVWLMGNPTVSTTPQTVNVSVVANEITSSIPFYVSQSSSPWLMNGGIAVTNTPTVNVTNVPLVTVQGTSSVNVISSAPHAIVGTVSTQVVSSIPFFVAQSSAPWLMNGALAVTNSPNVNVTNVPAVNISSSIPFFVAQSSGPWLVNGSLSVTNAPNVNVTNVPAVNITSSIPFFVAQSSSPWSVVGTTTPNIVSSIPYWVAQSSAPWAFSEVASTAGGTNATTIALAANLNTTVVKASAGQVYGVFGSNVGSSNVFVRLYNISTAALTIASSAVPLLVFGMPVSTSPLVLFDMAVAFNAGISLIAQQQPYTASSSVAPTASTATITILYK